ncbi:MAG: prolipoprotein diacylglyceryl transferase [Patescibacteria group bacterium]|nr:prolipoprotein diacylglyceryl transferase [Patescibacteria group bacterium]
MFNFLHTFNPSPILAAIGPIHIYWYGFFIVLGILAAIAIAIYLAKIYGLESETIIDLSVWLIVGGLIGARAYDIFLEWPYFSTHPLDVFKVWQGGLAIHGAIIGGLIALWLFAKKHHHNFWQLAGIAATTLPLAQAIGRWGNYFNQELFGYPTNLPWGIPIDMAHRPWQYMDYNYFHPAFLYESLGCLLIFIILIYLQRKVASYKLQVASYLFMYGVLRFAMEFIRLDATPVIFGLRFPQIVSLLIVFLSLGYFCYIIWLKISKKTAIE